MKPSTTLRSGTSVMAKSLKGLLVLSFIITPAWLLPSTVYGSQPLPAKDKTVEQAPAAPEYDQASGFTGSVQLLAHELTSHLSDANPAAGELSEGIAVCSFVDLKKLTRTSSFGRYLAEQLMNEFQHRGYTVVELRKTTSLLIQEQRGEYSLSRNPEELNTTISAGAVLTGTYTPAGDSVLVNAKIIDNRNSTLLASATLIFPRNQLVTALLADTASAHTGEREVIYMKRLEL